MSDFELHRPTDDVQSAFNWLTSVGFTVVSARGGPGESFGNQLVELSNGSTTIRITRDRGQWALDLTPDSWSDTCGLLEIWPIAALEHVPSGRRSDDLPVQLPVDVRWRDFLPRALEWTVGYPHRGAFVEVERQRFDSRLFGGGARPPSLDQIERWTGRLAAAIDAPPHHLPTYGSSEDLARPHIEVFGMTIAFVVVERGEEVERHESAETIDLLERIFRGVTFNMAVDWEVGHRDQAEDFRRRLWAQQLVLLDRLHPLWAKRLAVSHSAQFSEVELDPRFASDIVNEAGPSSG